MAEAAARFDQMTVRARNASGGATRADLLRRIGPIVLVGDIGGADGYHVGDEAMVSANLDWWRAELPGAEIVVTSQDPEFSSRVHGVAAVKEPRWARRVASPGQFRSALRRYRGSRFLSALLPGVPVPWAPLRALGDLIAGAALLHLSGGGNLTSRFREDLRFRSTCALLARAHGVPVLATGQTLGPRIDQDDAELLRAWMPDLEYLSVRDEAASLGWAGKLGVREDRLRSHLDDAYWLEGTPSDGNRRPCSEARGPVVGLTLHAEEPGLHFPEDALRRLAHGLDLLAGRHDARFVFLPHVTSPARDVDLAIGKRLKETLGEPDRLEIREAPLLDRQVKQLTSGCGLVVATRYHALVFALGSGVPCLGLHQDEYTATKIRGLFSLAGMPCVEMPLSSADLTERILEVWGCREKVRGEMLARNKVLAERFDAGRRELAAVASRLLHL